MPTHTARASAIGDVWGIATDPLKLGKASEKILEAIDRVGPLIQQVNQLEGTTNQDLRDRLDQLQAIVDEVTSAVDRNVANVMQIVAQAEMSVAIIEQQVYADAVDILSRTQCLVENVATDEIQRAISAAVGDLRKADPSITFLGFRIINLATNDVQVLDPDQAYVSIRDNYLLSLAKLKATDPAYKIVSIYANISRIAALTRCHYQDKPLAVILLQQEREYDRLAWYWTQVVHPRI